MVSKRKRLANRRNARKSTGPRTARGKAIVSRNAITHGLLSQAMPVLPFENEFEYRALADALERDLQPQGILQRELVTHIAQTLWRIRRVPAIEAALLEYDFSELQKAHEKEKDEGKLPEDDPMPQGTAAIILAGHFSHNGDRPYERLEIYRLRLERSITTATRQLEKLRGKTAGEEIDPLHQTLYLAQDAQRLSEAMRASFGSEPQPSQDNSVATDADRESSPRAESCEQRHTDEHDVDLQSADAPPVQSAESVSSAAGADVIGPNKATAPSHASNPCPSRAQGEAAPHAFCDADRARVFSPLVDGRLEAPDPQQEV